MPVALTCSRLRLRASLKACRYLNTAPLTPHAYLRPLVNSATEPGAEELEGVMCLVLDRKEARNALSVQMVQELREGIAKAAALPSFVQSARRVSLFLDSLRAMLSELEALLVPTVAVVDGFAMGGGTELALGCDLRVGGPGTKLALPETKLGIIPGAGGTQRLTHLVGTSKAKELIFTGRRLGGEEAERIGLLNVLVREPQTAWEASLILSRQILTSAPLALKAAKTAINAAQYLPREQGLDLERSSYNTLLGTSDRLEGLKAFAEKRRAIFTGQ